MYRDRSVACPVCRRELERDDIADRWTCPGCNGMLISIGEVTKELLRIAPSLRPDGGAADLVTLERRIDRVARSCPMCARPMRPVFLAAVAVERCMFDHHLWLDAGELERIEAQAERQREDPDGWIVRALRRIAGW
jgi:Zn-finger nucleic acid-binding protein